MVIGVIADPPHITHSCAVVGTQLAKQFVRLGHSVHYLAYNGSRPKYLHEDGFWVYPDTVPPTRKASVLHFIDESKVEIIVSHGSKNIFAEGIQAAKEKKIPYIPSTFWSTNLKTDKVATFEASSGHILGDCSTIEDIVVCNQFSTGVGNMLGKKIHFIPNGADIEIFNTKSTQNYRAELGIPANAFVVLYSGTNQAGKDPLKAINSFYSFFKKIRDKNVYLVLHTRPKSPYMNLQQVVTELGIENNVRFFTEAFPEWLDFKNEYYGLSANSPPYLTTPYELMPNVYRTGDVQLVTSLLEGCSSTMIEGAACSLPIICSDDPVISELVIDGSTGFHVSRLVSNECIEKEIVEKLEMLYNDKELRNQMSWNAEDLMRIKYDWAVIAKQYLHIFEKLLQANFDGYSGAQGVNGRS